uniref:Retrovirus-related Pol polyprotein from transposon TNT 1-94 n=1 Tax=Tanacetum cinerariifolium TaxID=118510 RepID=A0A699H2K3_TANCI|nr:retrovirus-related Pol polyprotein from transposon TNT 1-94 [Tanacetum cinerariifolium]
MIIAGADNRHSMLEKSMYDSWKSRFELYIENRENGRMILNYVLNGTLVWRTVAQEDGTTRTKKYEELSVFEKLQPDCDLKATNIVLQGLPPDVYAIVNHQKVAKDTCDRVKLLILPPEWSKFMTDVKLARDLHTINYDQLYSYLEQHEAHANETRLMRERYQDPLAFVANFNQPPSYITNYHSPYNTTQFPHQTNKMIPQVHSPQSYSPMNAAPHLSQPQISHSLVPPSQQYQSHMDHQTSYVLQIAYHSPQVSTQPMNEFPQLDSGLAVLVFTQGDNPIACLNKAMAFLKCTQLKRPRNATWFKDKAMLAEAQESGQLLDEEQLAFLADPGIRDGQAAQTTISNNDAFQTEDLDAYDFDCDDVSNAKAILMANLSNYGSYVISEVPHSEPYRIKRRRRDLSSDIVRNLATTSGRGQLKEDLESSTWRWRQDYKATPERTRLRLFQFSLYDQASNWLERLPAGSITTCEDLTTRFLAQFFPSGRTAKFRNNILMFQQHHEESLSEAWTRFKDLL